ncbi:SAF domain-containing protein [Spirillospora sp. CA-294931]|uniref:SAF domain-containing protein n=1 Tax=Spirillospora sp. CA-294931 TaxID=3240042 RepID=UPI003D910E33
MKHLSHWRRPLAATFAATGALAALLTLAPEPPPSTRVLAAARDLPAGRTLTPSDLHPINLPPEATPAGALRSNPTGRTLSAPMRRNEPLTDARLTNDRMLADQPGKVATPVRISDAGAVRLLHVGDRVDILAGARLIVTSVPILAIPQLRQGEDGALIVLATDRPQAAALSGTDSRLSVSFTGP